MVAPTLINTVFAASGDVTPVPEPVQGDGSVSFAQGYGIAYSTPVGSGGINIERDKMNYLLNTIFAIAQQYQFHSTPDYYADISAGDGYMKYDEVLYNGIKYQSLVDDNADLPTVTASWFAVPLGGNLGFSTGDGKPTYKIVADPGWIMGDDGTIGNAASGASTRANADTQALFTLWWNNCTNTDCPVSGGRGASALADFNANKTIRMPLMKGRAFAVAGQGSGLTLRRLGQSLGEESHTMTTAELASHTHVATVTDPGHSHTYGALNSVTLQAGAYKASFSAPNDTLSTNSNTTGVTVTNATEGNGTAFNVMQPTSFVNIMIKL